MQEKIGNLKVLASNSLLVEVGKPIEIFFGDEDALRFIFNIINNPSKETFSSESRLINQMTIELDLFNFVSSNLGGGGTSYPVKVGTYTNKALYYSFNITSVGAGVQPLFTYTFYLGEEVIDG